MNIEDLKEKVMGVVGKRRGPGQRPTMPEIFIANLFELKAYEKEVPYIKIIKKMWGKASKHKKNNDLDKLRKRVNNVVGESYLCFEFYVDLKLRCLKLITDSEQVFNKRKTEISESKIIDSQKKDESIRILTIEYEEFEIRNHVIQFLGNIVYELNKTRFFHSPIDVNLEDQFIDIQVTSERINYHHIQNFGGYTKLEEELEKAYAHKGIDVESIRPITWEEAKKRAENIVVLADPGMGKSTLLKMEAIKLARQAIEKLEDYEDSIDDFIFPIYLKLIDLAKSKEKLLEAIPKLYISDDIEFSEEIVAKMVAKLRSGKCILLLDALDEVPKEYHKIVSEKINRIYRNYHCQIICTSRIVGYTGYFLDYAKEVEITPLNQNQIETYINTWFRNAANTIKDESVTPEGLLGELKSKPQVQGLAQTPLILSLLCSLYQQEEVKLPARRTQIYKKALLYMLGTWSNKRSHNSKLIIIPKIRLLEELAYKFSDDNLKQIFSFEELYNFFDKYLHRNNIPKEFENYCASDLIDELSEDDGILVKLERDGNRYIFLHRTFQEFLTASYEKRIFEININKGIESISHYYWNFDWHEIIVLLAGLLSDPLPLLNDIYKEKDDIFANLLMLTGKCIAECEEISQDLVVEVFNKIFKMWIAYPNVRYIKIALVGLSHLNSILHRIFLEYFKNENKSIKKNISLLLGEIGSPDAVTALIKIFVGYSEIDRENANRGLGNISNPDAIPALIEFLKDDSHNSNYYVADSFEKINSPNAVVALVEALRSAGRRFRHAASFILAQMDRPDAMNALIEILVNERKEVRNYHASNFRKIDKADNVPILIEILKDKNYDVRINAIRALGKIGSPDAIPALIWILCRKSDDSSLLIEKIYATISLGEICRSRDIPAMDEALFHENEDVRALAASVLRDIGSPEAVAVLIRALRKEKKNNRSYMINALGGIGSKKAISALIEILCSDSEADRLSAIYALGETDAPEAIHALIEIIDGDSEEEAMRALTALGEIGSADTIPALIKALSQGSEGKKYNAAFALERIGGTEAIPLLLELLRNGDSKVKRFAALALGLVGTHDGIPEMIEILKDKNLTVLKYKAIKALKKIYNINILKKVIELPEINIYEPEIFSLARGLAIHFYNEDVSFIPVYPEEVEKYKN